MKEQIVVPRMGESISEATVGAIIKTSGSQVRMDDEIIELETDKVNQVLHAPQNGKLTWSVAPGDTVKIGQVIGVVDTAVTDTTSPTVMPQPIKESAGISETSVKKESSTQKSSTSTIDSIEDKKTASKTFFPQKKETESLDRSGERVRIDKEAFLADIHAHKSPKMHPKEIPLDKKDLEDVATGREKRETRTKMTKIRKVIAARLLEAQHTTAMLTTFNEVDMTQVMALRERYKEAFLKAHGVKIGFMSFFIKAVVSALQQFPAFNSYIDGEDMVHREYYDISIAVGTDRGLVVPVIRGCDHLSFAGVEQEIEKYAKKAREGTLTVDDFQGGGFTITNGGVYGSLLSTPILNSPQCGILGMHKIEKRAVVINDSVVIRSMMYLALSYDHRIVDGKEAVSFLVHIKECLEDPSRLLLF